MAIVHWNPWSGLDDLRDKLDRILAGEAARPGRGDCGYVWQPASDVYETETGFVIQIELPGVRKNEIIIEIKDRVLLVYGERRFEREAVGAGAYQALERCYGPFARRFLLSKGLDENAASASLEDGVLTLVVPKAQNEGGGRRIVVEAG